MRALLLAGIALFFRRCSSCLFQIPGVLEALPVTAQAHLVSTVRGLMRILFAAGSLGTLVLAALQIRAFRLGRLPNEIRRRAQVVGLGLLAGFGPPLLVAVLQLALSPVAGRPLLPRFAISLSFLPVLAVPLALSYAMLAPRVQSVGLLARKALLITFAGRTISAVSLAPLAALVALLYRKRQSPVGEVFADHTLLVVGTVAVSIAGLRWGGQAREALERLFYRARGRTPESIARIAEGTRRARDVAELADALAGGVERALVVEQAGLFVKDEGSGTFVCPGRALPALDASSPPRRRASFPFQPDDEQSLLAAAASGASRSRTPSPHLPRLVRGLTARCLPGSVFTETGVAGDASAAHLPALLESLLSCRRNACPNDDVPRARPGAASSPASTASTAGSARVGWAWSTGRGSSLGRDVAIKTLPRLSRSGARRLQREARAAARLVHPNLGLIFAAESWHGTPMLVLEYLPGGTLSDRIRKGPLSPEWIVTWGSALAGALEAIHRRGILHRDIKPSNVGFTSDDVPKLLDFGLARLLDEAEPQLPGETSPAEPPASSPDDVAPLTASSRAVGTVPYLSPEALQGLPPVPAFDLWSLSLTLYEAFTGTNPYACGSSSLAAERILRDPVPDPRSLRPDCPPPLAELLLAALPLALESSRDGARAYERSQTSTGRSGR
ncbi:MAG: serine/threonine protein kinase [Holophagales bacterium]|nr:serine/threonine protein kinase [Holophagales bacterium]